MRAEPRLHHGRADRRHDDPDDPDRGCGAGRSRQIQRGKERELRRDLWEMRDAIDRYKDAADRGAFQTKLDSQGYPPDLETLVKGVDANGKKLRFLRQHSGRSHDRQGRVGLALHAGRSGLGFLGRAERLRVYTQVGRHRAGRDQVQNVVAQVRQNVNGSAALL